MVPIATLALVVWIAPIDERGSPHELPIYRHFVCYVAIFSTVGEKDNRHRADAILLRSNLGIARMSPDFGIVCAQQESMLA